MESHPAAAANVEEEPAENVGLEAIETFKRLDATQQTDEAKKDRQAETIAWKIVLYNDDIHRWSKMLAQTLSCSFAYVTDALVSAVPQLSHQVAHTITVEAHNSGQATILATWKRKAEYYCAELQKRGLTVCAIHNPPTE
ncbi:ATP-dependent Clp protease adaptor, putative [Babesia ovata]|uniref:ATP-dependent Clp protease adaptor, putative n=1 Tax=Babesia ovata TaxID=189622 RepID=A0A2H6KGV2_9APIC|nr:ATP-dependent Clp protease adaptor, putative [Babesia ovata]GBE62211.1 ATP-dependent Clp protease adaptor, putative [Babesia ovata]